jgi:hypothetical protein
VKADGTGRVVIGWVEFVDLPEWRIHRLRAKVDTGARSSALHVENIRELKNGRVRFDVRLHRRKTERRVSVEAPITRKSPVRSSMGHSTTRIFVEARVRIGATEHTVELSLVDREKMIFRMLIGRSALAHHYLVDAGRRYLQGKPTRSARRPRPRAREA